MLNTSPQNDAEYQVIATQRLIDTLKMFVWGYCLEKIEFVSEPSSLVTQRNKTYKHQ